MLAAAEVETARAEAVVLGVKEAVAAGVKAAVEAEAAVAA